MAAAEITEKKFVRMPGIDLIANVKQATQYDWVLFDEYKGVSIISAKLPAGTAATITRGQLAVNNGSGITATATAIAYDKVGVTANMGINRPASAFYILTAGGEIIEAIDPTPTAATGTLTLLKRGALGTTAGTLADNDILYIANSIILGDSQTAPIEILFNPYPNDPGVKLFS